MVALEIVDVTEEESKVDVLMIALDVAIDSFKVIEVGIDVVIVDVFKVSVVAFDIVDVIEE